MSEEKFNQMKGIRREIVIIVLSCFVFIWMLMPSMFSHQSAIPIVIIIGLVLVLICTDSQLPVLRRRDILFRYVCCGVLSLFFWAIDRRDSFSFVQYAANNMIIWFPVVFSYYLIYKQPKVALLRAIFGVILFFSLLTGVTTLYGLRQFPMASRWLAGAHTPEMITMLRGMNIGGYSYIYAMGLLFPIALGLVVHSGYSIKLCRILCFFTVLLLPIVIFFSQYMIALYMVIFSVLATLVYCLANLAKRKNGNKTFDRKVMFIVLPITLVMFVMLRVPIHYVIRNTSHDFGLISLEARANSVLLSSTNEEYRDEIWETLNQERGQFEEGFNERGDAVVARSKMYAQLINTIPYSPLLGRLSDNRVLISNHSEFLDGLLGGGIIGALIYISLLYLIFSGLLKQVLVPSKLFGNILLMGCLLIGLGAVNTLTKSREIILMCTTLPVTAVMFFNGMMDIEAL